MSNRARANAPNSFWIAAVMSLLFNFGGVFDYMMIQTENAAYMADFNTEQIAYFTSFSILSTTIWAVGVWAALGGSVLLVLRSRHAVGALAAGVVALLIFTTLNFANGVPDSLDTAGYWGLAILVWVVELMLFLYARRCVRRSLLR